MGKKKGSRKTSFGAVSVVERGSWVRIRWRENGKTVERSKSTWEEACTFARQVEARLASGGLGSPEGTFGGVADAALRRENFANYSDKAYETLRSILRIHIMPSLGSKKARLVTTADCAAVLRAIFEAGYSKHTVAKARKILSKVGAYGVKHGVWTAGQEPTLDVPVPKSRTTDMNVQLAPIPLKSIPVESQVESLLAAAKAREQFDGGRAWFVIEMAQLCALRWSEIRALRKTNFNWDQRTVSVWTSRDSEDGEKMPKTSAGARRVVIPAASISGLRKWVESQPDGCFLVDTKNGTPVSNGNWSNTFNRLRDASGFPLTMALHSLRHYRGSKWRRDGKIPLEDISRLMGHANPWITQMLYLHSDPEYLDRVKNVI
jgi:integrase